MIRTFPIHARYPMQEISRLRSYVVEQYSFSRWYQEFVFEHSSKLFYWACDTVGIPKEFQHRENVSVVYHRIFGGVEPHTDGQSKRCFLIPIRHSKHAELLVQGSSRDYTKKMIRGNYYVFSDYNEHALIDNEKCIFECITVDFHSRNRNVW